MPISPDKGKVIGAHGSKVVLKYILAKGIDVAKVIRIDKDMTPAVVILV
jgi:hypothetical protein